MTHPLYPYGSVDLMVLFVYGMNIQRQTNILLIPKSIKTLTILIMSFVALAAVVLNIIRKRFQLRRFGLLSTFLDTMVAFVAGGNLRMHHRLERWFFGILLIGAFFITSIFTGDLLNSVYYLHEQKITTFGQLAEMNSSIYAHSQLRLYTSRIHEMLRLVGYDEQYEFSKKILIIKS